LSNQPVPPPPPPLSTFCEWIPSGSIDMDFTNNLSQITGKLATDLRKKSGGKKKTTAGLR
ncbi:hypothetical protein GOODEAATRI_007985, partial [Goodea atripinnis]